MLLCGVYTMTYLFLIISYSFPISSSSFILSTPPPAFQSLAPRSTKYPKPEYIQRGGQSRASDSAI